MRPSEEHIKLLQVDRLLSNKIMTLKNEPRYSKEIQYYFNKLPKPYSKRPMDQRYDSVLNTISGLWVGSNKSPSIFKDVKDFEPLLQRLPNYRDHFIHSFNVFLIGYYLINRIYELNNRFNFRVNDLNLTWMLASTFHDVAYPLQEIDNWLNEFLKKFLGAGPTFSLNIMDYLPLIYQNILNMISSWHINPVDLKTNLNIEDWEIYNEISSSLIKKDHGVLGGLMLAYLLAIKERFGTEDRWGFLINHRPACHAICVHHLKSIPIRLTNHPFSFILSLCDELQDWGRPSKKKNNDVLYLSDILLHHHGEKIYIEISVDASNPKKQKLVSALSNLRSGEEFKIKLKDINGDVFFEMNSE